MYLSEEFVQSSCSFSFARIHFVSGHAPSHCHADPFKNLKFVVGFGRKGGAGSLGALIGDGIGAGNPHVEGSSSGSFFDLLSVLLDGFFEIPQCDSQLLFLDGVSVTISLLTRVGRSLCSQPTRFSPILIC